MTVFDVISMLGGLALFLYGMSIMGDGLRSSSTEALKKAMDKVTNNPIKSFLLGVLVTAIIQSSTATIVLTSGLVAAGILSLHQSLGIIMGANVGTTITAQIIRLLDLNASAGSVMNFFKPSTLAPLASIAGIIMIMMVKKGNAKTIGEIAMGFGILFTGLMNMTASVSQLSDSQTFKEMFLGLGGNPILGFLAGAAVAFLIQSSSASVGILQALSITGALSFGSIYSILLGIYVGDAVTTGIVCSIGAKADARRTGIVQVLFNAAQVVLIFAAVMILKTAGVFGDFWTTPLHSGGIANIHTAFKLICAVVLLPFAGKLEALSRKIVKDDPEDDTVSPDYALFDEALFRTPGLALSAAFNGITDMAEAAFDNVSLAMDCLVEYDEKKATQVIKTEDYVDRMTDLASEYLAKLAGHINLSKNMDLLNYYLKCATEFERIGDHALNLVEKSQELRQKGASFSTSAIEELKLLHDAIAEIGGYTLKAFTGGDYETALHIEPVEEVVDRLVDILRDAHLDRLKRGECSVDSGFIFLDMLVNVERISDQCSNVGLHTIALFGEPSAEMEHEYARGLHSGFDSRYNDELTAANRKYMSRLERIGKDGEQLHLDQLGRMTVDYGHDPAEADPAGGPEADIQE